MSHGVAGSTRSSPTPRRTCACSDRGPFWPRFWFDERPPAYPLVLWLTGGGGRAVVLVQSVAYVMAWIWLGAVVWQRIASRPVAVVTIGVLGLTAVQARWALWTTQILTESLSITLAVAAVAAWWQFVADPLPVADRHRHLDHGAWMLLRDSNAVTFTVFAVPALVFAILVLLRSGATDLRRYSAIGLAVLVVVGGYSWIAQVASDRGESSFHNNVGLRWLPDPEMSSFFESRGMPIDEALVARVGRDTWADGEAFLRDPALADYRDWADGRGRIAAVESFVVEAPFWFGGCAMTSDSSCATSSARTTCSTSAAGSRAAPSGRSTRRVRCDARRRAGRLDGGCGAGGAPPSRARSVRRRSC